MRFRFSRRAEADIEEVGDYIARDNPARAVTFIAELRARCRIMRDIDRTRRPGYTIKL